MTKCEATTCEGRVSMGHRMFTWHPNTNLNVLTARGHKSLTMATSADNMNDHQSQVIRRYSPPGNPQGHIPGLIVKVLVRIPSVLINAVSSS